MSGLFPGVSNSQNIDRNGKPLAGSILTVFNAGTLVLASVFQDLGLAVAAQNPMTADITGRLPIFYVADGTYRVRLTDQTGVLIYDYPQVASIGASTSGGGGTSVDPTTVFQTGDELWRKVGGLRTGWVRQNGLTLGSATSGASERANADTQNLFLYLWNNYPNTKCPVVGGRGASALADFNANKQITLPDMRGKGPSGLDGMGNARANLIPDSSVTSGGGDTGDTAAAFGGEASHTLSVAELAAHNHTATSTPNELPHTHNLSGGTIQDNSGSRPLGNGGFSVGGNASAGAYTNSGFSGAQLVQNATTGLTVATTIANSGSGTAHNNMPPFVVGTWYVKL